MAFYVTNHARKNPGTVRLLARANLLSPTQVSVISTLGFVHHENRLISLDLPFLCKQETPLCQEGRLNH